MEELPFINLGNKDFLFGVVDPPTENLLAVVEIMNRIKDKIYLGRELTTCEEAFYHAHMLDMVQYYQRMALIWGEMMNVELTMKLDKRDISHSFSDN